jgi:hypothetical protein
MLFCMTVVNLTLPHILFFKILVYLGFPLVTTICFEATLPAVWVHILWNYSLCSGYIADTQKGSVMASLLLMYLQIIFLL